MAVFENGLQSTYTISSLALSSTSVTRIDTMEDFFRNAGKVGCLEVSKVKSRP